MANTSFFCYSLSRHHQKTSKASALSDAQNTSDSAYFLNPDWHSSDCIFEILPETVWFLRIWYYLGWLQIYPVQTEFFRDLQSMLGHLVDWLNQSAKDLIRLVLPWQSLIPLVLRHGLRPQKYVNHIIRQLKSFKNPITLMIPPFLIKQLMALCQLMPPPSRQYSRCTSMAISVMPINSESLQMVLALSVTLLSTTRIF